MKKVYLFLLSCFAGVASQAQTTVYSVVGTYTYTVAPGVTALTIDMAGAQGGTDDAGSRGGFGGRVQCVLAVTGGEVLNVYVGGQGTNGDGSPTFKAGGANGTGGGGEGGPGYEMGAGGGGSSDIRIGGTTLADRVIVGGGGGGAGQNCNTPTGEYGGDGGGLTGGTGYQCGSQDGCVAGNGGTQIGGGLGSTCYPSTNGTFGQGGGNSNTIWVGGGGGGYYGGGSGQYGGGGGGSSYYGGAGVSGGSTTPGFQTGDGYVIICVNPTPGTISGASNVCVGSTTTLTDVGGDAGGTWSSSDIGIATVGGGTGIVTGVSTGNATITYTVTNSCGGTAFTTAAIVVNPLPTVTLGTMPQVCAGVTSADIPFSATDALSNSMTFTFTGSVQTWTVPSGVTSVTVDAIGAAGGFADVFGFSTPVGKGGRVQATLAVTAGQVLNIYVGGRGANGSGGSGATGGYNGGGNSAGWAGIYSGGGGGGASDIRIGGTGLANREIVAGGGGGVGYNGGDMPGGDGGGLIGASGAITSGGTAATGGTQLAGGTAGTQPGGYTTGTDGALGIGGDNVSGGGIGAGGGGGYYGGGGGTWGGGGGGSSYTDPGLVSGVIHTQGFNTADGSVTISYSIPTTYDIVWDAPAGIAGFTNVTGASISASPITVTVPTVVPNTYTGTLDITNSNTGCTSAGYGISVTVKPIPDVTAPGNQSVCNGTSTTPVTFTGSLPGTTFDWTNSNSSIGLGSSGSGDIGAFIATNAGATAISGVITVTPTLNGCTGTAQTFTVTVKPSPDVYASSNQILCNGAMTSPISFAGPVAGTTFSWTNTDASIGLPPAGTGDIAAFTATNLTTAPVTAAITVNTTANGCTGGSNTFTIIVNPTPILTSLLNPAPVCDNTTFNYTSVSATIGTTYSWSRAAVTGISNPANSGVDNISEVLHDTTPNPIIVIYVDTLKANGCVNTQNVNVVVNPTPILTSTLTPPAICDSTLFTYPSTSATGGTTYTWSRAVVPGISNPAGSGADTINEYLENITPNPVTVTYIDTLLANGCSHTEAVTVVVNPKPILITTLTPPAICDSATFHYVPMSATVGTTHTWSRAAITGISNPAGSGTDSMNEVLYNTTVNPITVVYVDTLRANGCWNTQNVSVAVNPTPKLTSTLTPPGICDSARFDYPPTSATVGSTFAWGRPFVLGIGLPAGSGSGNPSEYLDNNTNDNLTVVYVYTITANGCSHVEDVSVVVHPTPTLSSNLTPSVCSGTDVNYNPTSYVFGTTFTWQRANVAGITPATSSGAGTVHDTLKNGGLTPLTAVYVFTLTANGCPHTQSVKLTLNPTPPVLTITTHSPSTVCANTLNQNFGVSAPPPANQDYHWSAQNATVWATGANKQYCLVNFNNSGYARVMLVSNVSGISCTTSSYFDVNVTSSVSSMPQVVYYQGQFLCLQTDEDNYQWGYDDDITLDSTILIGENNPNYVNAAPSVHVHYWVITNKNGCMEKTYYKVPTGITNINEEQSIKVYPNPTSNILNVEINTSMGGNYELDVVNMLGQKLSQTVAIDNKARIDVARLASGCYLVDCYRDGVKIASVRFIKN